MNKIDNQQKKATVIQIAKAVLAAFMGIRKKSDHEFDAETLTPIQVVIGGLIGGALFVISVLLLVNLIVS
ncbi:MAG: DUF2970 domain-containing protein [Betaproteobacteria bacterium]|nr:DUF2970 domain-containing protein [Betaproteobacteria bacterium]